MSKHLKIINPLAVDHWDDLLCQHPDATFFHSQCWAKVLSETYGYEPKYFAVLSDDKLCFLLPTMEVKSFLTGRRGVSLPFTDFVSPLVPDREAVCSLWPELIEYAKKFRWQHIDLRGDLGGQTKGHAFESFCLHDVRLESDTEKIFSSFSNNNRRNIKKAIREGVEVEICRDMESVDAFYNLNSITRKRHGIPSQPYVFFKNIHKYITREGKGVVVLARKDGEVVAGAIYFFLGGNAIFKYGASKKEKTFLRANNLVMWEAIKWLSSRNFKNLNLGRTAPGNSGLLRYKNGWASEQKTVSYYRYNIKNEMFVTKGEAAEASLSARFFKMAPLTVSNFLGRVLYRHVG